MIVGSDTTVQGRAAETDGPPETTCDGSWVVHRPAGGEVFDPSVAVEGEPPGWIWLEGALVAADEGDVRLCDRAGTDCASWAPVGGIDPASLASGREAEGLFIGLVRDDAIEGLMFVPNLEEAP